ncbi:MULTISPECIES: DUF7472 family protein [Natrialba]|uniref:Transporter n=2 Tax=Natrialba TaxID=63742 RepID=M0AHH8_NATA1|nr:MULTISPECIES: hypothetical protein [Natrialba]ELY97831.1 hypothetical protein C481_17885 [Natrialba asiatica DSM 12278]ELZ06976.1 hypothetical protein C480_08132 [Natrialba aegyptia DSM 13077]
MLERERLIELVVAVSAVLLLLGTMIAIGMMYGGDDGTLSPSGAQLLVGAIVGFILVITSAGFGVAYMLNDPEDGDDDNDFETQNAI